MKITFWGTRGSIPVPGKDTVKYGGNTTCVSVETDDDSLIVIDAGTGIKKLGGYILKKKINEIYFFLTHSHWDHIQGFPFFVPAYIKDFKIKIFGASPTYERFMKIFTGQMKYLYFPVEFKNLSSIITYEKVLKKGSVIKGLKITAMKTIHPLETHSFKFEINNKKFVFMTDNELDSRNLTNEQYQEFIDFVQNADLLIHDAQYSKEEYNRYIGWGHSTWEKVVEFSNEANVKKVYLTHHDPDKTDEQLDIIEKKAQDYSKSTEVFLAREGITIEI
uniref:MBL fold metallo-hydrolase n=1 Tax=candidate division WOR-3 bacterium TaxID=2052148 RepID=A0A7C4UB34_UNCW3